MEVNVRDIMECKKRCIIAANCRSVNILANADGVGFVCQINSGLKENGVSAQFVQHAAGEYYGLKVKDAFIYNTALSVENIIMKYLIQVHMLSSYSKESWVNRHYRMCEFILFSSQTSLLIKKILLQKRFTAIKKLAQYWHSIGTYFSHARGRVMYKISVKNMSKIMSACIRT
jgi:hypothetical protein